MRWFSRSKHNPAGWRGQGREPFAGGALGVRRGSEAIPPLARALCRFPEGGACRGRYDPGLGQKSPRFVSSSSQYFAARSMTMTDSSCSRNHSETNAIAACHSGHRSGVATINPSSAPAR